MERPTVDVDHRPAVRDDRVPGVRPDPPVQLRVDAARRQALLQRPLVTARRSRGGSPGQRPDAAAVGFAHRRQIACQQVVAADAAVLAGEESDDLAVAHRGHGRGRCGRRRHAEVPNGAERLHARFGQRQQVVAHRRSAFRDPALCQPLHRAVPVQMSGRWAGVHQTRAVAGESAQEEVVIGGSPDVDAALHPVQKSLLDDAIDGPGVEPDGVELGRRPNFARAQPFAHVFCPSAARRNPRTVVRLVMAIHGPFPRPRLSPSVL